MNENTDNFEIPNELMNNWIANGDVVSVSTDITMLENMTQGTSDSNKAEPSQPDDAPRLVILTEPKARGFRFRYGCEGGSHGGLPGADSERGRKTYPAVKILNYQGMARIVVSLVTNDSIPTPHAHSLVGKQCDDGICTVQVGPTDMTASFPNLGIRHVTKKQVPDVLRKRISESDRLFREFLSDPGTPLTEAEVADRAKQQASDMDLSVVRLCFQAYLADGSGSYTRQLDAVVSKPVYDSKAPNASQLKICRMDRSSGCCTGGDEVYLLCDKVQKDDIQVRFFEDNGNGDVWEQMGDFGPTDVHRQYAIVFKTPKYRNIAIDRPVSVMVQLRRKSDSEVSEPKPFTYHPQQFDKEEVSKKRKKTLPYFGDHLGGGPSGSGMGGSGGGSTYGSTSFAFGGGGGFQGFTAGGVQGLQRGGGGQMGDQRWGQSLQSVMTTYQSQAPLQDDRLLARSAVGPHHVMPQVVSLDRSKIERRSRDYSDDADVGIDCDDDLVTDAAPFTDDDLMQQKMASLGLSDRDNLVEPYSTGLSMCFEETKAKRIDSMVSLEYDETKLLKTENEKPTVSVAVGAVQTDPLPLPSVQINTATMELAERTSAALRDFCVTGDVKILLAVQRHLTAVQDENGDSALHLAVIHGHVEVVHSLLSVIISIPQQQIVNRYNNLRQTPLHLAVITGQPEAVELLLRCGADVSKLDRHGNTAAHLAAELGSVNCLKVLLRQQRELKEGKRYPELDWKNYEGFTCVHLAVKAGSLNCLRSLVSVGANVNEPDGKSGHTALHHAVEHEHLGIIGYLILEAQSDLHAQNFAGDTVLHIASGRQMYNVAALLVAAGSDPWMENYEPLEESEDEEQEKEIDTSDDDSYGETSLDLAMDDQMAKILKGEPYHPSILSKSSHISAVPMATHSEKTTSQSPSSFDVGYYSVSRSTALSDSMSEWSSHISKGDMIKLDPIVRNSLLKLLDVPRDNCCDWRSVAEELCLGNMINAFKLSSSPTKILLDNFEAIGGTIEQLQQALYVLNRKDALKVLEEAGFPFKLTITQEKERDVKGVIPESCESGLGSIQASMISRSDEASGMTVLPSNQSSQHLPDINQPTEAH
ncbi:nuclear factor kappa-B [Saccoglossus kowalevskii]|uniref:NFkB protein n=1 Tax=Saccoglossus kowalevskii TaxID=10224 RepID=B5M235_SACKO|nr:nuclear factor kappa-B [Saccoglossus kowalevskii]ACH68447.1 NFkB protein [Saccoglossus kowalevskii]